MDFFHLLVNVLCLWQLGLMMEENLGARTVLLFVLVVAVISNTCQYLVAGPMFGGLSGIIMGILGFFLGFRPPFPAKSTSNAPLCQRAASGIFWIVLVRCIWSHGQHRPRGGVDNRRCIRLADGELDGSESLALDDLKHCHTGAYTRHQSGILRDGV